MSILKMVEGTGNHVDRAEELARAISDAIHEKGEGMTFAAVIGCLEIVKATMLAEAAE
jgi:hypothetical protein